jgi:hypothetical protein
VPFNCPPEKERWQLTANVAPPSSITETFAANQIATPLETTSAATFSFVKVRKRSSSASTRAAEKLAA